MSTLPETMFDIRHIERYLAEGQVTREQYDAYLASLDDGSENLDKSAVRFVVSDRRGRYDGTAPTEDEG